MKRIVVMLFFVLLGVQANGQAPDTGDAAKALFAELYVEDQSLAGAWAQGLLDLLDDLENTIDDQDSLDAIPQFENLIGATRQTFSITDLEGDWRMRSYQATDYGAFIYPFFPARIFTEGRSTVFHKNTGSQRHLGVLAQLNSETVFFVGALYYGYEDPRTYSAFSDGAVTSEQREFDAVAELYKIGNSHFLMAFAPNGNRYRLYEIRR